MNQSMFKSVFFILMVLILGSASFAKFVAVLETTADSSVKEKVSLDECQNSIENCEDSCLAETGKNISADCIKDARSLSVLVEAPVKDEPNSLDVNSIVGQSVPTNVKSEKKPVRWVPIGISAAAIVAGIVIAVVENIHAKNSNKTNPDSKGQDDVRSAQTGRAVGLGLAILGATGLGLSFVF